MNAWDQFENFKEYDAFTSSWLTACRRILKDYGHDLGNWLISQYLPGWFDHAGPGYWFLNDVVWIKGQSNAQFPRRSILRTRTRLFSGRRRTKGEIYIQLPCHEIAHENLQMRSDWGLPVCNGKERLAPEWRKAHPTQSLRHSFTV